MKQDTRPEKVRLRRLNIRLSEQEWDKVHKLSSKTTCRSVSEYARKVLSEKPVRVFYRNQSFDAFEEQMNRLLPVLENIADNFDRLVNKIGPMENSPELKENFFLLLTCGKDFSRAGQEIRSHIEKIADQCDQK